MNAISLKAVVGQCPKCGAANVKLYETPDHPNHDHLCSDCGVQFYSRPEARLVRPLPPNHEEQINLVPVSDARACYRRYKDQLTDAEREWMENFFAAYYRGDEDAAKALGMGLKERRNLLTERNYNSHAARRYQSDVASRRGRYSVDDYIAAETSPEDAMLTAFAVGKKS